MIPADGADCSCVQDLSVQNSVMQFLEGLFTGDLQNASWRSLLIEISDKTEFSPEGIGCYAE